MCIRDRARARVTPPALAVPYPGYLIAPARRVCCDIWLVGFMTARKSEKTQHTTGVCDVDSPSAAFLKRWWGVEGVIWLACRVLCCDIGVLGWVWGLICAISQHTQAWRCALLPGDASPPGRAAHAASHCAALCAAFSRNVGRNGAQKPQYRSTQGGTPGAPGNLDALEASDVPEVSGV